MSSDNYNSDDFRDNFESSSEYEPSSRASDTSSIPSDTDFRLASGRERRAGASRPSDASDQDSLVSTVNFERNLSFEFEELDQFFTNLKQLYITNRPKYKQVCAKIQREFNTLHSSSILTKSLEYICVKTQEKFPNVVCYHQPILPGIPNTIETFDNYIENTITSFMYYGYAPGFLSRHDLVENGFYEYYFLWQKKDDPNKFQVPYGLTISNDNFKLHNRWSIEQLNAYYFANILPKILQKSGLNININSEFNKKSLTLDKKDGKLLKTYINLYINTGSDNLPESVYNIIKDFNPEPNDSALQLRPQLFKANLKLKNLNLDKSIKNFLEILSKKLLLVKFRQILTKASLHEKLSNMFNVKNRFKWQNLCSTKQLSILNMEELQELAILESIPYYLMMTKRELCAEFAKRFSNIIEGKKKIEPKCINTTSILGTTIDQIPPEFFFSYIHNNKIYCDDIRDLNKHFELNGNKHPIDRSIMKDSVVNRIIKWYKYLVNISNNMLDFDDPVVMSMTSQLSSKMASLSLKLNYPKDPSLFITSNQETFNKFLNELVKEEIINNTELRTIEGFEDLNRKKLLLIDMLMLKIKNDPQQVSITGQSQPLSVIAINLSNTYNNIF